MSEDCNNDIKDNFHEDYFVDFNNFHDSRVDYHDKFNDEFNDNFHEDLNGNFHEFLHHDFNAELIDDDCNNNFNGDFLFFFFKMIS